VNGFLLIGNNKIGAADEAASEPKPDIAVQFNLPAFHITVHSWKIVSPQFNGTKHQVFVAGAYAATNCCKNITLFQA
jgi:hypothetical protein